MNRRELLAAVGAGATGVAGLLGVQARGAGRDGEATTTTTTSAGEGFTGIESAADRPFARISVGTRAGVRDPENNQPHAVRVWNDSDRARAIGLRLVRDGESGTAVLDRRVEFPADGYLTLRLLEPGDYALTVPPGAETSDETMDGATTAGTAGAATSTTTARGRATGGATVAIPRAQFDCNDSRTDVRVAADGGVRWETVTTEESCPPEMVERTFTAFRGTCGSADDAAVSFDAQSVAVSGSIRAPNPCYGAELAEVAVPSADSLRVVVATTEPTAEVCAQCVASIEYRADLAFRDRVPGTVEVVHRRGDETETVASVTRDGTTE
jgi:hypothetical protein